MHRALSLLLLLGVAWAQPATDLERLTIGLPAGFRKPNVVVHPVVDQRALFGDAPADTFWADFSVALTGYANLTVTGPEALVAKRVESANYKRQIASARALTQEGLTHYRNVRLVKAATALKKALAAFAKAKQVDVDRAEVGKTAMAYAQALQEAGDAAADAAFEGALRIDPNLKLRAGFDRPEAVAALERARKKLSANPPAPAPFSKRPKRSDRTIHIYARMLADRVELAIHARGGIRFESQSLTTPDAPQRLASRVWACLPFGRAPGRARLRKRFAFDVGFTGFTFLKAPVDPFVNFGVGSNFSWLLAENLTLDGRFSLTVSDRDSKQDLRNDITAARVAIAPGATFGNSRFRFTANLGIEGGYLGEVQVTTNPACKHFEPSDGVPPAICDFERDIDLTPASFVAGPVLVLGTSVRIIDQIYLAVRAHGSLWLFETEESGLGTPVGAEVSLGYRLF